MAAVTERLEVRLARPELLLLRQEARRRKVSVAELVREAVALLLDRERTEREQAAEDLFRIDAPVNDWEVMKGEIAAAHETPVSHA